MSYLSRYGPKIECVFFLSPMMIGVPVSPTRAAFGQPLRSAACNWLLYDRCASSTLLGNL
jgi:hypothetical protein